MTEPLRPIVQPRKITGAGQSYEIPLPIPLEPSALPSYGSWGWNRSSNIGETVTASTSIINSSRLSRAGWLGLCMAFFLFLGAVAALVTAVLLWRNAELTAGPIGPVGPPGPEGPTGNLTGVNPLTIGNISLEDIGNQVLDINGSLLLPLTLWHQDGDNVTIFSSMPGPVDNPLFRIDTPGGLYFNQTLYGQFSAPDCPDFTNGLLINGQGSLKPNTTNLKLEATDDLFLCTEGGSGTVHVNVGCSPRGEVELGEVQTVLALDQDACIVWEPNPSGPFDKGICHNGTCATINESCLVFDGTTVSFINGAYIEGDLFVSGNLTYTNMMQFNISEIIGDLTVTECLYADCVVTNNLTVSTNVAIGLGAAWSQSPGGSFMQNSPATFNNLVTLNSNTLVQGPNVLSVQNGADLTLQNGATFVSNAGAMATCASPLFDGASGCVETCPDFSSCDPTFNSITTDDLEVNGQFTSGGSATAMCTTPIFTIASGCVEYPMMPTPSPSSSSPFPTPTPSPVLPPITCPDFSTCNSTFNSITVGDINAVTIGAFNIDTVDVNTETLNAVTIQSTNGGTLGGTTTVNNLVCTGIVSGCGGSPAPPPPPCPDFSNCSSTFASITTTGLQATGSTQFAGPTQFTTPLVISSAATDFKFDGLLQMRASSTLTCDSPKINAASGCLADDIAATFASVTTNSLTCTGTVDNSCSIVRLANRRSNIGVIALSGLSNIVGLNFNLASSPNQMTVGYANINGGTYTLPFEGLYTITINLRMVVTGAVPSISAVLLMDSSSVFHPEITSICERSSKSVNFQAIPFPTQWSCTYTGNFSPGDTVNFRLAYDSQGILAGTGVSWDAGSLGTNLQIHYIG